MYISRKISSSNNWMDESGVKLYTISTDGSVVDQTKYLPRLNYVKLSRNVDWDNTASFAIFHDGATCDYLVLVWWGNGNELFTSVSVKSDDVWIEDPSLYSFCLYDLEVMWAERNIYIHTMDCSVPSLENYRITR